MIYVVGTPVAAILSALTGWLSGMTSANAVLLGLLLGGMMAVDMGGPVNKSAYTFAVGAAGIGNLPADGGGDGRRHDAAAWAGAGDPDRQEPSSLPMSARPARPPAVLGLVLHHRRRDILSRPRTPCG